MINKRVKIILLGLMIWVIKFMAGSITFIVFGAEVDGPPVEAFWINGILELFLGIGLALALWLVYRVDAQDYKSTGWKAGISWYATLLLLDLIILIGLMGVEIKFWFPSIITYFTVAIIPVVVGYLLEGLSRKSLE